MTYNENAWFDIQCFNEFGRTWEDLVADFKEHILSKHPQFNNELDGVFWSLRRKKIMPSYSYFKDKKPTSMSYLISDHRSLSQIYDLMFESTNKTFYVTRKAVHFQPYETPLKKAIKASLYKSEFDKAVSTGNVLDLICVLSKIAESNGANNAHFTVCTDGSDSKCMLKSGNWMATNPNLKYANFVIERTDREVNEDELRYLLDLSAYNADETFEVIRYRRLFKGNPSTKNLTNIPTKMSDKRLCFGTGSFVPKTYGQIAVNVNLHECDSDGEFKRCCRQAGLLAALLSLEFDKVLPIVGLCNISDKRFNLMNLKAGAGEVKTGMKAVLGEELPDCVTCVAKEEKMCDMMLAAPGFEEYEESFFTKTLIREEGDPDFSLVDMHFSKYAKEDPFKKGRFKYVIPFTIHENALPPNTERTFSRLIKGEMVTKSWLSGGWVDNWYVNFLRFTLKIDDNSFPIIKDYLIDNFKLFPCITFKKTVKDDRALTEEEYKKLL